MSSAGEICTCPCKREATDPGALEAELLCQLYPKVPAASATRKAAARFSVISLLVLRWIDENGHMPAYLVSNLTTLMNKSKMANGSDTCWTRGPAIGYLGSIVDGQ